MLTASHMNSRKGQYQKDYKLTICAGIVFVSTPLI
jgi:hypothetical protein